jgi:hypothetical protein
VENSMFLRFLKSLASLLPPDSWLAYDFKRSGVADEFGVTNNIHSPFRLPFDENFIKEQHATLGFKLSSLITPMSLMLKHVPSWNEATSPLFHEDAIVQVRC